MSQFLAKAVRSDLTQLCSQTLRWNKKGKVTEATVQARKERKRLKETNQFTGDYTGERPPHPWLSAKRLRSIMTQYQNFANKHRFNVKVDRKDAVEMKKQFEEIGAHEYYRMRTEQIINEKNNQVIDQINKEIETLPFNLYEEMTKMPKEKIYNFNTDANSPYVLYFEQIARMFDEEHFTKLKVSQRLQKLAEDKLGEND
ncbi:hypothetical protein ABPG74_011116 [Tetrahymena malaccensis]